MGKIIDDFSFQEQLASMQRLLDAKDIFFLRGLVLSLDKCFFVKIVGTSQHPPRGGV